MLIHKTANFEVVAADRPHVDRRDGGHIKIVPWVRVSDRTKLLPAQAFELMLLTMIVGEAMSSGLNQRGIDIGRINYQDNGNWGVFRAEGPHLHIHLYGRARSAIVQKFGDALHFPQRDTGFYDRFEPLNTEDVAAIRAQLQRLLCTPKYREYPMLKGLGQSGSPEM